MSAKISKYLRSRLHTSSALAFDLLHLQDISQLSTELTELPVLRAALLSSGNGRSEVTGKKSRFLLNILWTLLNRQQWERATGCGLVHSWE